MSIRSAMAIIPIVLIIGLAASSPASAQGMSDKMTPNSGMMKDVKGPTLPAVQGYLEGQRILFVHTESSDPKIAKILTDMMGGSPVLVVPALANAPKELLAPVYVFTNGGKGDGPMGPLGGQPDIFVHGPGTPGYSPLREVLLVTWNVEGSAQVLKSFSELKKAIDKGSLKVEKAGIIVNMPFLTWPGGKR